MPWPVAWRTWWSLVILLGAVSCSNTQPRGPTGRSALPAVRLRIRLDLRPLEERRTSEVEISPESAYPDTTSDGFPGWLSVVPDSMKAVVTGEDHEIEFLVHMDKGAGPVDVTVHGPNGVIRRTTLKDTAPSPVSWRWDIRDASRRRVAPGLYEVHVQNRIGMRIGYLLIR